MEASTKHRHPATRTANQLIEIKRLLEIVIFEPTTGLFRWTITRCGVQGGRIAGSPNKAGYIYLKLDGIRYSAHRVAWFWTTGKWPENQIDHIDGDKANNRIANLRESTVSENAQNQTKAQRRSAAGLLGVAWIKKSRTWCAYIGINGKQYAIGSFDTPEAAHQAYLEEKRKVHPFCPL